MKHSLFLYGEVYTHLVCDFYHLPRQNDALSDYVALKRFKYAYWKQTRKDGRREEEAWL